MRGSVSEMVAPMTSSRMAVSLAAMLCPVHSMPTGWLVEPSLRASFMPKISLSLNNADREQAKPSSKFSLRCFGMTQCSGSGGAACQTHALSCNAHLRGRHAGFNVSSQRRSCWVIKHGSCWQVDAKLAADGISELHSSQGVKPSLLGRQAECQVPGIQ